MFSGICLKSTQPKSTFLCWEKKKRKSSELMSDISSFWLNKEKPSVTYYLCFLQKFLNFCVCAWISLWMLLKDCLHWLLSFYSLLPLTYSYYTLLLLRVCWTCSPFIGGFIWVLYSFCCFKEFLFFSSGNILPSLTVFILHCFISHPLFLSLILYLLEPLCLLLPLKCGCFSSLSPSVLSLAFFSLLLALSVFLFCLGLLWALVYVS